MAGYKRPIIGNYWQVSKTKQSSFKWCARRGTKLSRIPQALAFNLFSTVWAMCYKMTPLSLKEGDTLAMIVTTILGVRFCVRISRCERSGSPSLSPGNLECSERGRLSLISFWTRHTTHKPFVCTLLCLWTVFILSTDLLYPPERWLHSTKTKNRRYPHPCLTPKRSALGS